MALTANHCACDTVRASNHSLSRYPTADMMLWAAEPPQFPQCQLL